MSCAALRSLPCDPLTSAGAEPSPEKKLPTVSALIEGSPSRPPWKAATKITFRGQVHAGSVTASASGTTASQGTCWSRLTEFEVLGADLADRVEQLPRSRAAVRGHPADQVVQRCQRVTGTVSPAWPT